jgi:hypothetical protein
MLMPLIELIRHHVFNAERIHGDDTTVPVLAKNKTATERLRTYVRDHRPFGGPEPPVAIFYYSRNRSGERPARHLAGYTGSTRRTPMPALVNYTRPGAGRGRSPRRRVGPMVAQLLRVGRSAESPTDDRGRPPHRRDLRDRARTQRIRRHRPARCSPGSCRTAGRRPRRVDAPSALVSRVTPIPPRRSITCSNAGRLSPASSMTAASA